MQEAVDTDRAGTPPSPLRSIFWRRRVTVSLSAFVMIAGCVAIGSAAWRGIDSTRALAASGVRARGKRLVDWDTCIAHQIQSRLPPGTPVMVPKQDPYWRQGLPALATPWTRVVSSRKHARFLIVVTGSQSSTPPELRCGTVVAGAPYPLNMSVTLLVLPA